jgi:bifunctional DNase/RNase
MDPEPGIFKDMPEENDEPSGEGFDQPPPFFPFDAESAHKPQESYGEPVEVQIEGVYAWDTGAGIQPFVLLTDGERQLRILIGPFESNAIRQPLDSQQPDRPMTHDLLKTLVERLGGVVEKVVIDDLWSTTYYAKLFLRHAGEEIVVDCRPSDAIALAVRCDAPIFVAEGILEHAEE